MHITAVRFIAWTAVSAALAFPAWAADAEKTPSQHERFAACAHESKGLKGDAHQDFMSECLKGHDGQAAELKRDAPHKVAGEAPFQQSKMKICNDEAARKNVHGDERRSFMSSCLKN